jgi:hypothetical protein
MKTLGRPRDIQFFRYGDKETEVALLDFAHKLPCLSGLI